MADEPTTSTVPDIVSPQIVVETPKDTDLSPSPQEEIEATPEDLIETNEESEDEDQRWPESNEIVESEEEDTAAAETDPTGLIKNLVCHPPHRRVARSFSHTAPRQLTAERATSLNPTRAVRPERHIRKSRPLGGPGARAPQNHLSA